MDLISNKSDLYNKLILQILLLKLLLLKKKIAKNKKHERRWFIRPINQKKIHVGYFATMFQELKQDPDLFVRVTRMNLEAFNYLCAALFPYLLKTRSKIYPEERLAITLRFLATGDSIFTIALEFRIGYTTCLNIIVETCQVIHERLSSTYLTVPNQREWSSISNGFWENWQMPNCLGSIDGKHVSIMCPPNSHSLYYNYKKSFSIILLAVCNFKYEFTLFDVKAVGSESDGGVLARSELGKALREGKLNIPMETKALPGTETQLPLYFVGDEAFQMSTNLMRPYPGRNLEDRELIFNYRLSRARRIIENSFGILASRWQFLSKSVGMYPDTVVKFVLASVCLHNFLMKHNDEARHTYCPSSYVDTETTSHQSGGWQHSINYPLRDFQNINVYNDVLNGNRVRELLADYFLTKEGEVLWQYDYLRRGTYRDV